jgi:hypothetical protein
MKFRIERMKFITRDYIRSNRDKLFLFGDNLERRGLGGQAAAMRSEPNAVGIPTKKGPSYRDDAFFSYDEFEQNKAAIDAAFLEFANAITDSIRVVVIPSDGLGTGRAQLDRRAPRTFAYLQKCLSQLGSE